MVENLMAFGVGVLIAIAYFVIGTVVVTFVCNLTDPDDILYMLVPIWPFALFGVAFDKLFISPVIKYVANINKKRLENKEDNDES